MRRDHPQVLDGLLDVKAPTRTFYKGSTFFKKVMLMAQDALIEKLISRQQALADFGSFAFRSRDLQAILDKAAFMCATAVDAPYCKVCRFRSDHNDLLIEAGYGWKINVV